MSDVFQQALDDEWIPRADGSFHREASRVLWIVDGYVLLQAGHEPDDPDTRFWFTPGGGVMTGETSRAAAVRELAEETGLVIQEQDLIGPVATWDNTFTFWGRAMHQLDTFFACFAPIGDAGLTHRTDVETHTLDGFQWVHPDTLTTLTAPLYPPDLPEAVAWLQPGWDGSTHVFTTSH